MLNKMRHVTAQPLSDQGWGRCQAEFQGVDWGTEERTRVKYQKRKRSKKMGLESVAVDEQGSLDIDWSSSSDNLSDAEPLPHQEASRSGPRKHLKRKKSYGSSRRRVNQGPMRFRGLLEGEDVDIMDEEEENLGGSVLGSWMMKSSSSSKNKDEASSSEDRKSTQIVISDYDSPSEEQGTAASSSQQASSSLHISDQSPTPQPSPCQSPDKESPRTGTELLKKLKLPARTPDKEAGVGGPSGGGDSTKKKRKFVRGGLAEGLQRVINREKSAMAFWAHRTVDTATSQSLMLDLLVLSVEEARGLYVTRCRMCPFTSEAPDDDDMLVLFAQANGRQLKLGVGSRIRVYPPWQKLTLPNYKETVILCTYFCHPVDTADETPPDVATTQSLFPNKTAGMSLEKELKPVRLFQPLPKQTTSADSTLQLVLPNVKEAPADHVSDSFLDSIAQSGGYTTAGMCVRARIHRVHCRGSNAEPVSMNRKQQGFSKPTHESSVGSTHWALILQDNHGVFCELQVTVGYTGEEEEIWRRSLRGGEGKTMVFAGLKVMRRVNRTRFPGLFSLIDSLWSPCDTPISQSEAESQSQGLVSPQSFCYILGVQMLRNTIREEVSDRVRIPYREPVIHTLREVQQLSDETSTQRVTFFAKVVHAHSEVGADNMQSTQQLGSSSVRHLFLTDHTLCSDFTADEEDESGTMTGMLGRSIPVGGAGFSAHQCQDTRLVYVHVRVSCHLTECVQESLANPGSLMLFRDVCLDQGCSLHADTYTAIQSIARKTGQCGESDTFSPKDDIISSLSHAPVPPIPTLDLHNEENTLVSVAGVVTGVDETTAYSWPACNTCGNNRLEAETTSGSQLHCGTCQKVVTSPVTRKHLELFLRCPSLKSEDSVVKVRLLQPSIEHILPPLNSQEEGYDLQCIMGVSIGPVSCFLRSVGRQPGEPLTFDLEEVSL
ncbi:DNA repair-scaffolding protein-like [Acanthaster planci]|uniref:DNA repair-scaffolding protein-like n=1 Tax=Acanthaster planci TaxID=133434 RepID=A0A8B8A0Q1_ACAPL|nr:DNA repair-scaffolding protein-like [Acanthaster planci]